MTNYEKIKNLSLEEMTEIIMHKCRFCIYKCSSCIDKDCYYGVKKWLESEVTDG